MTKAFVLLAALAIASPARALPGVDFSANHICPGVAGANSNGGFLDCAALANSGGFPQVFATFKTAEAISDLSNLDGQVDVIVGGSWDTNGQFWDSSFGSCMDNNGANPLVPGKPVSNCGDAAHIRPVFDSGAQTTLVTTSNTLSIYYTVYTPATISVTTAQRIFGFEIRYDPIYAAENGGTCGTCATPVMWVMKHAQPGSLSGKPTTDLITSTGEVAGCIHYAYYNNSPVPTRARSWGQLKSLYR